MGFGWWHCLIYSSLLYFTASEIHANDASSLSPKCSDLDRSALMHFKQSFQVDCAAVYLDPLSYPRTKTWTVGINSDCCLWDGVECDKDSGNVIELDLSSSCLYGSFPENSTLFGLTHLRKLNLAFNDFNYSQIPSEIGQLRSLQSLNLSSASFSGQIPSVISNLTEITVLDLSNSENDGSSLAGLIVENPSLDFLIKNLTNLRQLYLNEVDISSSLPSFLTNFSSLEAICLQNSNLQGEVPTSLLRLPRLEIVRFHGNTDLRGVLPEFQLNSPLKELSLSDTAFSGEVPPSIGILTHLKELDLSNSQFSGSIPLSISNLTNLESLSLTDLNAISPQLRLKFSKLHRLTTLRLRGIKLDSEIPSFLANLTELTTLRLSNTQLKGQLPQWFANLTHIENLYLEENQLEGPIPHWISQLTMLIDLQLGYNNLSGNFDTFSSVKNLALLDLSGLNITFNAHSKKNSSASKFVYLGLTLCNLTEFPLFLRRQTKLEVLIITENKIKGTIPQWLINTTKESLLIIDLSGNKLTGFAQHLSVLPWTNLESFSISDTEWQGPFPTPSSSLVMYVASNNMFTGEIPEGICNAKSLSYLDLSNNNMSGNIPSCIGDQLGESLKRLNLRGNNLSGTISLKFTKMCSLAMINLSENKLDGDLPRSLSNCTKLQVLDIGKNRIIDTFPSWLGSQPKLQALVLRHNQFHGSIEDPKPGYEFRSLQIIDLSYNFFIGYLPSAFLQKWHKMQVSTEGSSNTMSTRYGRASPSGMTIEAEFPYTITITNKGSETLYTQILTVFRVLDFSSNKFTDKIPNVIGDLKGLQALNLSNNNLVGEIPPSLANIADLQSLDLSLNTLSGELPEGLSQLQSLEVFNVSYNQLSGQIPQGKQFNTFDNSSYEGNLALCGTPLSNSCRNVGPAPSSDVTNEDSEWIDWMIALFGCLSGFLTGFLIGKLYITDKHHDWFMETFQTRPKKRAARASRRR